MTSPVSAAQPVFRLAPLSRHDRFRVEHLQLPPQQQMFAGTIEAAFASDEADVDFHMGLAGDEPVCFFKIDRGYAERLADFDLATAGFVPGDLGLRAMIVGSQYQGKGYGKAAMAALPDHLRQHYPAHNAFLTVNLRNPVAIGVYKKGGWEDTGQHYLGGKVGPQHLFRLRLR
ncbi:GNAT family N-acetyltransferase [Rhizobium paknamense]|uniref:RimJ/RimL family protein N-acetyltransferase n=1 Tax=Rhizobium paknamense TaxID=1206817 RepID=A0ABU0ICM3_9HYPH|nr:GNAT family N-acetyltransferase [Rhizobium paknamense]MDQ0455195.1 RimJ/RimL family protein N-acetyltransferase [Rhizobium paknamense]